MVTIIKKEQSLIRILLLTGAMSLGNVGLANADAPRGFIGDIGSGWDSTSAVSVRVGHEHIGGSRLAIDTINGTGINAAGEVHDQNQMSMWLSLEYTVADRFGVSPGGHWIEYAFDQVYALTNMWIWNYSEGDPGGYAWSAQGLRNVTIKYTAMDGPGGWGSLSPGDWTTIFAGDMDVYDPGQPRTPSEIIEFGGAPAKYVLITTSTDDTTMNWVAEHRLTNYPNDDSGLSEVRFYPTALSPASFPLLGLEFDTVTSLTFQSTAGSTYSLEKNMTGLPTDWMPAGQKLDGDGSIMKMRDPAGYSALNMYRIKEL